MARKRQAVSRKAHDASAGRTVAAPAGADAGVAVVERTPAATAVPLVERRREAPPGTLAASAEDPRDASVALVLADIPERNRLRELQRALNERRDRIAEHDLEIETVRDALAAFESAYQARVAEEHAVLARVEQLVRHYERWAELLRETETRGITLQARRIETRRQRELDAQAAAARHQPAAPEPEPERLAPDERLKTAYRALARRYHPDLARSEEERVRFGDLMARINALYRDCDLERLETMAEQAKGGDVEEPELDLAQQLSTLEERLAWFDLVLANLREERAALERTPTCELMRNFEQARAAGRDLVDEIKRELRERAERSYAHVAEAIVLMEAEVESFNRKSAGEGAALTTRQSEALERRFDPFADKRIVRLGLEELRDLHVRPEARELAERLEAEAAAKPALLRLVLLTYVNELSPFPLPGLEGYEDIDLRFTRLSEKDEAPQTLEKTLVEADALVEYGVKRASEKVVRMALRFQSDLMRDAVPVLLKSIPIRREFKRVLKVLGEREKCTGCHKDIFSVPLFRTRGLDDLRALVCPRCGHTLRSYWMPKGKDVQAVLNAAFLDFEIVTEWSFQLGRGSFGTQLLPLQVEAMHVGDLKRWAHDDLFQRYELEIELAHLRLLQGGEEVPDGRALAELTDSTFVVQLTEEAKMREGEALEMLRHRVRNRFRA